jgi:hypothetical protein
MRTILVLVLTVSLFAAGMTSASVSDVPNMSSSFSNSHRSISMSMSYDPDMKTAYPSLFATSDQRITNIGVSISVQKDTSYADVYAYIGGEDEPVVSAKPYRQSVDIYRYPAGNFRATSTYGTYDVNGDSGKGSAQEMLETALTPVQHIFATASINITMTPVEILNAYLGDSEWPAQNGYPMGYWDSASWLFHSPTGASLAAFAGNYSLQVSSVPEPASLSMIGMAGLALVRRRR